MTAKPPNGTATNRRHAPAQSARSLFAVVFAFGFSVSCSFPWLFVDDFATQDERYRQQIERVLIIDESEEVVAEGVVGVTNVGCEGGASNCHFFLMVDDVPIAVYYLTDRSGESCINVEASERGAEAKNGNRVRVFGKYFELGGISTCGDFDYYVTDLSSGP